MRPKSVKKSKQRGRPRKVKPEALVEKARVDPLKERPRIKLRENINEYAPIGGIIPLIRHTEAPKTEWCEALLYSVDRGMGIETASAYAELPSALVRNWLARGKEEEVRPFDASKYTDEETREKQLAYFENVTKPCYALWMMWKKKRAEFLMGCVGRVAESSDWRAQAWLLERLEPGSFVPPKAPPAVKRILEYHEEEVRTEVADAGSDDKVVLYVPDNGRMGS